MSHTNLGSISTTGASALTIGEAAALISARLVGDAEPTISGVNRATDTTADQLTFACTEKHMNAAIDSIAVGVIIPESLEDSIPEGSSKSWLIVENADSAFITLSLAFQPQRQRPEVGISDRAVIADSAIIGAGTNIHPHAVIGSDVSIGSRCDIGPGVLIEDGCSIGSNTTIHANAVVYRDVIIGDDVIIHANCVIGADGYGYRVIDGRHTHILHAGTVRICNDVHIGPGSTINRAKVGETLIESGTRIGNMVMIAHNCQIGKHNLIVAQVGFAGSVTTGDYVVCAGKAGIADHVHLGDHSIIGAKAGVHRDVPAGESYLGMPAIPASEASRNIAALRRLPDMRREFKLLQKEVQRLATLIDNAESADGESIDSKAA